VIEDNGTGLKVSPEAALNPFYTTKTGKRTGLGLSLFRAAAEKHWRIADPGEVAPGGVEVGAEFGLSHIDRSPLGDLAGTFSSVVCTNPAIDFRFVVRLGQRACRIDVFELASEMGQDRGELAVAQRVGQEVQAVLESSGVLT